MPDLLKAIILGVVEGVTEFLPISSTGHLLLCERWMGLDLHDGFWNMFAVFIQIGAIAAVVVYFRARILELLRGPAKTGLTPLEIKAPARREPKPGDEVVDDAPVTPAQRGHAIVMIMLACTPLVIAYFADKWAEQHMSHPGFIAGALLVGGVLMILIERLPLGVTTRRIERISWKQALGIGLAQVLAAVFPGTSRSAATIMAGLVAGLSRPAAAEFSFFLAIPAMGAACAYKLLKYLKQTTPAAHEVLLLVIGTLVSFLVAWAVIAGLMAYIRRHSFVPFAIYRIVLGLVVLWLVYFRGWGAGA